MFICHCRAVTDGAIRGAIEAGARDPHSLSSSCGAGSRCGGCWPALQSLLAEYGLGPSAGSEVDGLRHATTHAA